jgi:hypothetical protein
VATLAVFVNSKISKRVTAAFQNSSPLKTQHTIQNFDFSFLSKYHTIKDSEELFIINWWNYILQASARAKHYFTVTKST